MYRKRVVFCHKTLSFQEVFKSRGTSVMVHRLTNVRMFYGRNPFLQYKMTIFHHNYNFHVHLALEIRVFVILLKHHISLIIWA